MKERQCRMFLRTLLKQKSILFGLVTGHFTTWLPFYIPKNLAKNCRCLVLKQFRNAMLSIEPAPLVPTALSYFEVKIIWEHLILNMFNFWSKTLVLNTSHCLGNGLNLVTTTIPSWLKFKDLIQMPHGLCNVICFWETKMTMNVFLLQLYKSPDTLHK